jgi:hypothetical protein
MSPMPSPVPVLASQQPNPSNIRPTLSEPLSEPGILNSIERPSLSPAYAINSPTSQAVLEQGRRLTDEERLIVIRICQSYARVYLNDKPQTQFWKLIQSDFKKQTDNPHKSLKVVVEGMVKARRKHLDACGTGTEPDGGDLNLALDAWILILSEKDQIKDSRKKSSNEIEAAAKASNVDRDNMKRSISEKKARDGDSSDEYSDISGDEHGDNIHNNELEELISNATDIPASPSSTTSSSTLISQSPGSALPQPTTPSLSRSHTPARRAKKQKKSGLNNEFKPVLDVLATTISKFANHDDKATDERLSKIEARIEEGQAELKTISDKMLALLETIAQRQ